MNKHDLPAFEAIYVTHQSAPSTTSSYVRSKEALFTTVDEDVLALSPEAGFCYAMENVAAKVMILLENPQSLSTLCENLMHVYEVDRTTCELEVAALLKQMLAGGLIEEVPTD